MAVTTSACTSRSEEMSTADQPSVIGAAAPTRHASLGRRDAPSSGTSPPRVQVGPLLHVVVVFPVVQLAAPLVSLTTVVPLDSVLDLLERLRLTRQAMASLQTQSIEPPGLVAEEDAPLNAAAGRARTVGGQSGTAAGAFCRVGHARSVVAGVDRPALRADLPRLEVAVAVVVEPGVAHRLHERRVGTVCQVP